MRVSTICNSFVGLTIYILTTVPPAFALTQTLFGYGVPQIPNVTVDTGPVNLGIQFTVTQPGEIRGVRFYRGVGNPYGYSIRIYDANGNWLAQNHVYDGTIPGWQEGYFVTPVRINANTKYTVAYYTINGQYAEDIFGMLSNKCNLLNACALANGGVYLYGSKGFPNQTLNSSNYWVDIRYWPDTMNIIQDTSSPTVSCSAPPGKVVASFHDIGGNTNPITWALTGGATWDFAISGTDIVVGPNGIAGTDCSKKVTVTLTASQQ